MGKWWYLKQENSLDNVFLKGEYLQMVLHYCFLNSIPQNSVP